MKSYFEKLTTHALQSLSPEEILLLIIPVKKVILYALTTPKSDNPAQSLNTR